MSNIIDKLFDSISNLPQSPMPNWAIGSNFPFDEGDVDPAQREVNDSEDKLFTLDEIKLADDTMDRISGRRITGLTEEEERQIFGGGIRHRGMEVLAFDARGHGHTQRCGNRGAGMRGAKSIECAFTALGETAQAAQLAQSGHAVTPAGEDFVRISLVAHIPDDAVLRGVENIVQRQREFHGSQVGTQMPAGRGHAMQQVIAQLHRQIRQRLARVAAQGGG